MSEESLQDHFDKHGINANGPEVRSLFFETFPKLEPWFEKIRAEVTTNGYVRYWSGRYWHGKSDEAYKGVNALIQGGAGDFLSLVLVRSNQILEKQGYGWMISIIHDEVLFEIRNKHVDIAAPVLAACMEGRDVFGVPFITDVEVGDSYGSLKPFETDTDISQINWQDYI